MRCNMLNGHGGPDACRVKRMLGLVSQAHGGLTPLAAKRIKEDNALLILRAIHKDPVDVGY